MTSKMLEELLETANSSKEGNTSVNSAKRIFPDESRASGFFAASTKRLLRIDEWKKLSTLTTYELFGPGRDTGRIEVGSFIRIDLYGSGKYDWVRAESITDRPDEFILTVRPCHDPTREPVDTSLVSHFFGPEASNNFCLQRHENAVAIYVIGINENQNTAFTDSVIESARNAAVANIGYYSGLQKAVWKEFCSTFLKDEEDDR